MRDSRGLTCFALAAVLGLGLLTWSPWKREVAPPVSTPSPVETSSETEDSIETRAAGDPVTKEPTRVERAAADEQPAVVEREELPVREVAQVETNLLTGRLVAAGRPLGGVRVQAWRDLLLPTVARLAESLTDADGYFVFNGLQPGIYGLLLEGPNVPRGSRVERVIIAEREDHDVGVMSLPAPGSLIGRLIDEDGQALAGVQVFDSPGPFPRFDPAIRDIGLAFFETLTDEFGRFAFEGVVPGRHNLLAVSPEYVDTQIIGTVGQGATHDLGVKTLRRGGALFGHVVDTEGNPISNAQVIPTGTSIAAQAVQGVRTRIDGSFDLRGLGPFRTILVRAEGFPPKELQKGQLPQPLLIRLDSALTLVGRVEGTEGRETYVRLSLPGPTPTLVERNGEFRIEGLEERGYAVRAETEGLGVSEWTPVDLRTDREPVVLTIQPYKRLAVVVRNDRGLPVANARVISNSKLPGGPGSDAEAKRQWIKTLPVIKSSQEANATNHEGRSEILLEPRTHLGLVVTHPDYLPAGLFFEFSSRPNLIEVVLERAARLSGRLTDTTNRDPSSLSVLIMPADKPPLEVTAGERWEARLDGEGRFLAEQLPAGAYNVALSRRREAVHRAMTGGQVARPTPILGAWSNLRNAQRVELHSGQTIELVLEAPRLGVIRGQVLHGNVPVAGVIVFAVLSSNEENNWDKEDAHDSHTFTTTARDGSYSFLYAHPTTWELRARHPEAPAPSPVSIVRTPDYGMEIKQDLHLGAGTVRGAVELQSLSEEQRDRLVAYLFRLNRSAGDPWSRVTGMKAARIGPDGRFEFVFVPEGEWVLRLVAGGSRISLQQRLRTEPYQVTDLGLLRSPKSVDVEVDIALPDATTAAPGGIFPSGRRTLQIIFRQPTPGREQGIFVRNVTITDGVIRVEGLQPGTYELELVDPSGNESSAPWQTLVVRPDGTTEPASLSFR